MALGKSGPCKKTAFEEPTSVATTLMVPVTVGGLITTAIGSIT